MDASTLSAQVIRTLKENGITFIKVHIPYPFEADGMSLRSAYITAKRAVKMAHAEGLGVLCQSFTPGGNSYNPETKRVEWVSYLPNVFDSFEDEYFYKLIRSGCQYIAKDLAPYANHWLVSNEPNLPVFTGSMTNDQIVRFLNAGAEGLKSGNPNALCGVNIFGSANPTESLRLVKQLYGKDTKMDFLGLDSYFSTLVKGSPESWEEYIDLFSEAAGNPPIMITEFSYSSAVYDPKLFENASSGLAYNNNVCRNKKFDFEWEGHTRSEQTQADYARACLKIFAKHSNVIGSCWFAIFDYSGPCWECGDRYCPMNSSWGLLTENGKPKPVLSVYNELFAHGGV